MIHALLSLAALSLQAAPAPASPGPPAAWREGDWVVVMRAADAVMEVDRATLRREGAIVFVRLRADFVVLNRGMRWGLTTLEVGCDDHSSGVIDAAEYDEAGVYHPREIPPRRERIRRDRPAWPLIDAICREAGWAPEA